MLPERYARIALLCALITLAVFAATASPASAAPSCAEGPQTTGETIVGTPCADTIRAPRGVTTVYGEGGDDRLYGQRGNDSLFGGEGNDQLYGGVGDDHLRGGQGDDRISGGFGADTLDGEAGSDFVRGDATIDGIDDTGGSGDTDTLSYATGVTPGFVNQGSFFDYAGFPGDKDGRGVYIDLEDEDESEGKDGNGFANDGLAPAGGGVDEDLEGTHFERVVGTPFPDFIVGSAGPETIYGGGGADVILGEGGADQLHGGAEGDSCDADPGSTVDCERSDKKVEPRPPTAIAVGRMSPSNAGPAGLYLTGSTQVDKVEASYSGNQPNVTVTFKRLAGSVGAFDNSATLAGECSVPEPGQAVCSLPSAPDSVVLAGLGGEDTLVASNFPETTSVILLGGSDRDELTGGATEDALVDGSGNDRVDAGAGDDAVPNNQGADELHAGSGEDLFISNAICEGDSLDGGPDRDNANWANFNAAISIDMGASVAGLIGDKGQPECEGSPLTHLAAVEDVEGTGGDDTLVGDSGENQLLGRDGHDSYFAAAGNDSILANSGDEDVTIDCGEGFDTAQVDHPEFNDPEPVGCEAVYERDPNSFRPPDTPPDPNPPVEPAPPPPPRRQVKDRTSPRTTLLHHPQRTVFTTSRLRRISIAFGSNEAGASFRCKLDRGPFKPCRSPRAYTVRLGTHAIRIFAIDRAGNRDQTPALLKFRVRRR